MISRKARFLLLALLAGCGKDQAVLAPTLAPPAVANSGPGFGRVVTSATLNGSAAPATITTGPNQSLAFVVGGFTTMDQVITTWLSTSVTFTSAADGSQTTRCNDSDVWTQMVVPGTNLSVSFTALAPTALGTYVVTVRAHQEDGCTPVFPSEPFPAGPAQLTLIVAPSQTPPVLASIGNQSVAEHATLAFNASATDSDQPPQVLAFTLASAATGTFPTGAAMSTSGAFSWTPNEDQGPGTYHVKVVVSDGTFSDDEEITISVAEVNSAPQLTLPGGIIAQWGLALPNVSATASDADFPANALTFAKVSGPNFVTVAASGGIGFGTIGAGDVGVHTVRVRVSDNGSPALSDEDEFTITVQARPTMLTYQGRTAGQYSDKSVFAATLTDAGVGPMHGSPIANAAIDFSVAGFSAGSAQTDATGLASGAFAITNGAGAHALLANFSGGLGYSSSSAAGSFVVGREDAVLGATVPGSAAIGSDLVIPVNVRELLANGAEPLPNDDALPGDVAKVVSVAATISGVNTGNKYQATCSTGSGGSASYASAQSFTCTFSGASLTTPDVYLLQVSLPASDPYYQAANFEAHLSVWDPNGGSATGGGSFTLAGDRVTFAFNSRPSGSNGSKSQLVVVRHLADGGICRMKSSDQMNPGVVGANKVTVSGKGEYTCHDALGRLKTSFSDVNIWLVAEDNGTPGAGADRIWIANHAPVPNNMLDMPQPVDANSVLLTGGNVTVRSGNTASMRIK